MKPGLSDNNMGEVNHIHLKRPVKLINSMTITDKRYSRLIIEIRSKG